MPKKSELLKILNEHIVRCVTCPRLVEYRQRVAREKRRAFRDWTYWGKPVPGFGDPQAELLILGLAPGAHGSNRTGRPFTGDRSGAFLYRALYEAGFANQSTWQRADDGLELHDAYITATALCAPPDNKPLPSEIANCRPYLERNLEILRPKAVLALGKIAWDVYLSVLKDRGVIVSRGAYPFAHGSEAEFSGTRLFGVYHPSQQNTQTGRVTAAMYARVLRRIQRYLQTQKKKRQPAVTPPVPAVHDTLP